MLLYFDLPKGKKTLKEHFWQKKGTIRKLDINAKILIATNTQHLEHKIGASESW